MPVVGTVTANLTPVAKSAAGTLAAGQMALADASLGAFTLTLPASPYAGTTAAVKKTDSGTNAVTVISGTSATIDGDSSAVLLSRNAGATFQFDGTNWRIVSTTVYNSGTSPAAAGGGGGGFMPWQSGRTYLTVPNSEQNFSYGNNNGQTNMTGLVFFPIYVPNACTVASLTVWNSNLSVGTNTLYGALYSDLSTATSGGPYQKLASGYFGAIGGGGTIPVTLNCAFSAAQLAWVAMSFSTSNAIYLYGNSSQYDTRNMLLTSSVSAAHSQIGSPHNYRYTMSYNGSTAPADMSGIATTLGLIPAVPFIWATIA